MWYHCNGISLISRIGNKWPLRLKKKSTLLLCGNAKWTFCKHPVITNTEKPFHCNQKIARVTVHSHINIRNASDFANYKTRVNKEWPITRKIWSNQANKTQLKTGMTIVRDEWILYNVQWSSGYDMMTSSNGNIFRVTGPLCGEFTGHRWIPLTKASDAVLWCFLWSATE